MDIFATNMKPSPHFSIDSLLGGTTRTISTSNAAFFLKGGIYFVHFLSSNLRWADETPLCPLLTTLVQFGLLDGGGDTTKRFVEREMDLLPGDASFVFVGDFVGASNALDAFVGLPPELLERVTEVHLQHYVPTTNSLTRVIDKHAEKIFLVK
jgi:hypothetical protein